jgi:ferrous iron transport protein A
MINIFNIDTKKLSELQPGESGIVDELDLHVFTTRLLAMGIIPGKRIEVIRKQPWSGSFYINIDGHFLGLRIQEADLIQVKL